MIRLAAVALGLAVALGDPIDAGADVNVTKRYVVVLAGTEAAGGFVADRTAVLALVQTSGGVVQNDLSSQVGVLMVESSNVLFAQALRSSPLVAEIGEDWRWQAFPSYQQAVASGQLVVCDGKKCPQGGPEPTADPLEPLQWDMAADPTRRRRTRPGRLAQPSTSASSTRGIDGHHPDFIVDGGAARTSTVRAAATRSSFLPTGPGVGTPDRASTTSSTGRTSRGRSRRRPTASASSASHRTSRSSRSRSATRAATATRAPSSMGSPTPATEARRDQHELLRRRRRVPAVDRVQVQRATRPSARSGRPSSVRSEVRAQAGRRARRRARQLGPGPR